MMSYTIVNPEDVEAHRGAFCRLSEPLGVTAFAVNQISIGSNAEGRAHDHADMARRRSTSSRGAPAPSSSMVRIFRSPRVSGPS
jgi:hypothetical protein